ncbi:DUF6207 family protein [Streptomyces sp. NPDC096934]|uniref:DUF6207 family protein n=1 Tax=Streptomyces sp. NPDC096934 TaxID=3155551 RepID=UPI00332A5E20
MAGVSWRGAVRVNGLKSLGGVESSVASLPWPASIIRPVGGIRLRFPDLGLGRAGELLATGEPAGRGRASCLVVESINEVHVSEPGLVVVDVAAADDQTAFAFQTTLSSMWAATSVERTTRDPGQPGVRLRCYLDMRQRLSP